MRRLAVRLVVVSVLIAPPADAQLNVRAAITETASRLAVDLKQLGFNTPLWLSTHLPAMMGQSGLGAGIQLFGEETSFAFGLTPLRVGFMNKFKDVGANTDVLQFGRFLPDTVPWLTFGATLGIAFSRFELGADIQFIPDMDLALGENIGLTVGVFSSAMAFRWRINDPNGPLPAFILGVTGGVYTGSLEMGAGFASDYSFDASGQEVVGDYQLSGSPQMNWTLWQVGPELKIAWALGPVRPYLGCALGFSFGEVTGGSRVKVALNVDTVGGQPVNAADQTTVIDDSSDVLNTDPALFTLRPFLGLDFVFGPVGINLQADFAVMNREEVGGGFGGAVSAATSNSATVDTSAAALLLTGGFRIAL